MTLSNDIIIHQSALAMSFNNTRKVSKPFCKVCCDAGKPEAEYTSHFVRSSPAADSVVVCPTLLAQECRYCHAPGHTVKFCKVLEKFKREEEKAMRKSPNMTTKPQPATKKANGFAVLDLDSEDERPQSKKPQSKEEYPVLKEAAKPVAKLVAKPVAVSAPSYAQMAAKPEAQISDVQNENLLMIQLKKSCVAVGAAPKPVKKSWADWSDSDSDEE